MTVLDGPGPSQTITDCHRPHRPYLLYLVIHSSCVQIFEKLVRIAENWPKFKKSDIFENGKVRWVWKLSLQMILGDFLAEKEKKNDWFSVFFEYFKKIAK